MNCIIVSLHVFHFSQWPLVEDRLPFVHSFVINVRVYLCVRSVTSITLLERDAPVRRAPGMHVSLRENSARLANNVIMRSTKWNLFGICDITRYIEDLSILLQNWSEIWYKCNSTMDLWSRDDQKKYRYFWNCYIVSIL